MIGREMRIDDINQYVVAYGLVIIYYRHTSILRYVYAYVKTSTLTTPYEYIVRIW